MTYSIAAFDETTLELGVAVHSRYPAVGSIVPWVSPGAGAVATQAVGHRRYGQEGLARLASGQDPIEALEEMLAGDGDAAHRQVSLVRADGVTAAHTGEACTAAAGHLTASGVSVQANIASNDDVWPAMFDAYTSTTGALVDRLLAALDAGEEAGGDLRGGQSASLLIAPANGDPWDTHVDVRVDDHPAPLRELHRLHRLQRAYALIHRADAAAGAERVDAAYATYQEALELAPDEPRVLVYAAGLAAALGDEAAAGEHAAAARRCCDPRPWIEVLERLDQAGIAPVGADAARRLLRSR